MKAQVVVRRQSTQPRPSFPGCDVLNPFYAHTERLAGTERVSHTERNCHAERSEVSAEPPEAESNVGWDESHQSIKGRASIPG